MPSVNKDVVQYCRTLSPSHTLLTTFRSGGLQLMTQYSNIFTPIKSRLANLNSDPINTFNSLQGLENKMSCDMPVIQWNNVSSIIMQLHTVRGWEGNCKSLKMSVGWNFLSKLEFGPELKFSPCKVMHLYLPQSFLQYHRRVPNEKSSNSTQFSFN